MENGISDELGRLDAARGAAARRFDSGPPLSGHAVVLPSAFNPPTIAHQHLLDAAAAACGAGTAVALLTTKNVDKGLSGAALAERIGMLLALAAELPSLAVVASNQARIVDQAHALEDAFPGAQFDFVVGFDTLERLFAPRYYTDMETELEPFFERHSVLAANRGDISAGRVADWVQEHAGRFGGRITVLEIDEFPASLSSTQARSAATGGGELHVAPAVRRYIESHGLYR